ncbi:MAG: peptide-N-glycosidase F-related protein, partial [Bacteroidales bacterium]|nr:peptide-N-glycosidase F-related protein [Bacteroidales bacterium]
VSFTLISGSATLEGNVLTLTGETGTVSLKASQAGNEEWLPAPDVFKNFEVIDAQAYTPTITIRRPYEGTMVYMPELQPILLVVSAYIEHNDALHIENVICNVDGQNIEAVTYYPEDPENGYFSTTWQPSAYGNYTMTVSVTTTGGKVTTVTNNFEVTNEFENIDVVTMNGDLVCTPSIQAIQGEYALPTHTGAFNAINAFYDHNCVNNNCDTYDRVGGIRIRNYRGEWMELFRYISPFGVQCEDNVDVSDYTSLLQGLVEFEFYFVSWNGDGFNPILTFNFTKGTPEYKFIDIEEIWDDTYSFGDYANQQPVPPIHYTYKNHTEKANLKLTTTGHNWSSNTSPNYSVNTGNAAEFYEATHNIKLNGTTKYNQHLWPVSGSCSPNPAGCQPQNGTWTYRRAGWCPGSIAMVWDYALDETVANGAADIQYEFDPSYIDMCHPNYPDCVNGQNGCPNCVAPDNPILIVSGKVVSYSNSSEILGGSNVDISELEPTYNVEIYPNPAQHQVTLTSDYSKGKLSVHVVNMLGQTVKMFAFQGTTTLNVSDLPKGVYLIQILGDKMVSKKLIIQ